MTRTIFLGIDGMDPLITERMIGAGELPNFERLASQGSYGRLSTVNPAQSPVAWSSIATGLSPAEHGIHDFIHRDPATYRPYLSLHRMERGRYVNPVRGETFWERAARTGTAATVLKWPMGFPPRPFEGRLLAGLGVPDIRGMLGTYTFFTSSPALAAPDAKGRIVPVVSRGGAIQTEITGPFTAGLTGRKAASVPLSIRIDGNAATCRIGRHSFTLSPGGWSPWLSVPFDAGFFRTVHGLCRFHLASLAPEFALYMTPVNVPCDAAEFPISHPPEYASELAAAIGPFATLGMAEDTNAVNDGVLDDDGFLALCDGVMAEREAIFLHELARFREGILSCVFDSTDRIQHIFWRMHDTGHPMHDPALVGRYGEVIPRYYRWMDRILGTALEKAPDAAILCCSDHGFGSFRHAVHLNSWLLQKGYLALAAGTASCEGLFAGVDWSRTKAYAVGLTGIYLNLRGREREGALPEAEAAQVKEALVRELAGLEHGGAQVMRAVHDGGGGGPDLVAGFAANYRTSWQTAVGGVPGGVVIEDNLKKWSGDHCCDAELVPGVIFCNRRLEGGDLSVRDVSRLVASLDKKPE